MTSPDPETQLLCHRDPSTIRFTARILESRLLGARYALRLDRTYFYPEGGGQPSDTGTLNQIPVRRVIRKNGGILHILDECPSGEKVEAVIDQSHRFKYQQQHTGQHIISAVLWKLTGCTTLSVHLGRTHTTIEINWPRLPVKKITAVEEEANRIVTRNDPVRIFQVDAGKVGNFPLRKPCPVIRGTVRLVQIGDLDCVACCGLHLSHTGEVGLIKAVGTERIRNHLRLTFKIGGLAYDDYRRKTDRELRLKKILKTKPEEFTARIRDLNGQLEAVKKENSRILRELAGNIARDLLTPAPKASISRVFQDQPDHLIKMVAKNLLNSSPVCFMIVNRTSRGNQWYLGHPPQRPLPLDTIRRELFPIIEAKGGGRPPLYSGVCWKPGSLVRFVKKLDGLLNAGP